MEYSTDTQITHASMEYSTKKFSKIGHIAHISPLWNQVDALQNPAATTYCDDVLSVSMTAARRSDTVQQSTVYNLLWQVRVREEVIEVWNLFGPRLARLGSRGTFYVFLLSDLFVAAWWAASLSSLLRFLLPSRQGAAFAQKQQTRIFTGRFLVQQRVLLAMLIVDSQQWFSVASPLDRI